MQTKWRREQFWTLVDHCIIHPGMIYIVNRDIPEFSGLVFHPIEQKIVWIPLDSYILLLLASLFSLLSVVIPQVWNDLPNRMKNNVHSLLECSKNLHNTYYVNCCVQEQNFNITNRRWPLSATTAVRGVVTRGINPGLRAR